MSNDVFVRSEITFATEPIISSLSGTLASARPGGVLDGVDLDETEVRSTLFCPRFSFLAPTVPAHSSIIAHSQIQKGILQIAHGLSFLHTQAKLIHNNLSPDGILINAKGDWKLGSLNMTTSLESSERWTFPEYDPRMPESVQVSLERRLSSERKEEESKADLVCFCFVLSAEVRLYG